MFVRNWGKSLFCVLLVCVVFLSLSFSFAADDMGLYLEDNYEENVVLSVSNEEVYSDLKCASDSDENVLEDDGDEGDDDAFNEDDPWVENLEEDSHDEEFEFISGFEPGIGPGMNPMDNRASTKLVVSSFSKYYRNGTQLVGYLQDASNNPLVGKTVQINIANANYTRTTDENGGFRLNINLKPNNYTSAISFAGDSNYKPSSKTITVKVFTMPTSITSSNLVKYYRNASQLVAQLKDVHGNPLVGKNITITILGNVYQRATDDDGYIHMNINMHPRVCNATLNFTENGYVSSKKVVSITVLEMPTSIVSSNLVKYYRNGSYWVARLLDGNGNPLAGKTLTFNIDTHTYTRVSDDDGYCYMTINLRPGTFTGTASFSEQYYTSSSKTISVNVLNPPIPIVNLDSGIYNDSSLLVNFSAYLENVTVFCSFDNGSTWYEGLGELSFNVSAGNWSVLSYVGLNGHNSSVISRNFVVDYSAPFVWASNGSAIYNESFYVDLYALDDVDDNPLIYYTLDGSLPDENSNLYNGSIFISNSSTVTTLRFISVDKSGQRGDVVNIFYFFGDLVANLNNGKTFSCIQDAIDDNETHDGDVIEVSEDLTESIILNKSVYLRACDFKEVTLSNGLGSFIILMDNVVNSTIEGFILNNTFSNSGSIVINNSSNGLIYDNTFLSYSFSSISDYYFVDGVIEPCLSSGNLSIAYNRFYGDTFANIYLLNANNFKFDSNIINGSENINMGCSYYYGILINSSIRSFFKDNVVVGGNVGVFLNGDENYFLRNVFLENFKGIYINGNGNSFISNDVVDNSYGIFSDFSYDLTVNFNRIVDNDFFGLYVINGNVDALNNWWGHNNVNYDSIDEADIYLSNSSEISFEEFMVLRVYESDYKIEDGQVNNLSYVADLRYNNFGVLFNNIFIPDCPVEFSMFYNNFSGIENFYVNESRFLNSGKASVNFLMGYGNNCTVTLDDESFSLFSESPYDSMAYIRLSSTAYMENNGSNLNYTICIPLDQDIKWCTVIWDYIGDFKSELLFIENGEVFERIVVESSFYKTFKYSFSDEFWEALELYHSFSNKGLNKQKSMAYIYIYLQNNTLDNFDEILRTYNAQIIGFTLDEYYNLLSLSNSSEDEILLWLIKNSYNLSDIETSYIEYFNNFIFDDISFSLDYFGKEGIDFNLFDTLNNESFSWSGMSNTRYASISYVNGGYFNPYDEGNLSDTPILLFYGDSIILNIDNRLAAFIDSAYDGFLTYAFASEKVNSSDLEFWLEEKDRVDAENNLVYDIGPMRAAYGSFLEAFLVIYCSDIVANVASEQFNVTWGRSSPMVMCVKDDVNGYFISAECDFRFGRDAFGEAANVKSFYFACSASFSLIENYVFEALFPGEGVDYTVTMGLADILFNNGTLEFVQDGNYTLIHEWGYDDLILLYDDSTGILYDSFDGIYGAYCYAFQQTEMGWDFGVKLFDLEDAINNFLNGNFGFLDDLDNTLLGIVGGAGLTLGMAFLVSNPIGWGVAITGGVLIGAGLLATYFSDDLNRGWAAERGALFGFDIVTSVLGPIKGGAFLGKLTIREYVRESGEILISRNKDFIDVSIINYYERFIAYDYCSYGTLERLIYTAYQSGTDLGVIINFAKGLFENQLVHILSDDY